ncbi:hypothetical protein SAMN05660642_02462 [Geodermatophilus siccatus]|uniref:Uncharacterized protein n=1 Tax=Geodermatophilus siccatus TaxID=1137991 RepID=A0A1G9T284_9ACTN|nr:hypothetical protein [Geodermatophilus siccatus]SDM41738.1 hypothetical protein SAMN05660642_02462 [Geodermatophilus siccatus]
MAHTTGPEAALYPSVEAWAKKTLGCWAVAVDTGPSLGRIDVVGLRDFGGGDLASRSEVVAIEVKRRGAPFAKSAGQAHGYSVMADRCYLAQQGENVTDEQMVVGSRLGIGLLLISEAGRVTERLTAPLQEPIPELRAKLLDKLDCATCTLCSTIFRTSKASGSSNVMRREWDTSPDLSAAANAEKGLMWWLYTAAGERDKSGRNSTYWRRYLCPDCVFALGSQRPKEA